MPILVESGEVLAVDVSCSNDELSVTLDDGRTVSVPLMWFPRLVNATRKERTEWELIGSGVGIHWEAIDEDISVASLLHPEKFMRAAAPALQPKTVQATARRPAVPKAGRRRVGRTG
jgi:hypothetical protein